MNEPKRFTLSFRAALVVYLAIGVLFGIALTMSEALSWYRIQEMFRFQSMHMYGIIGSAVATAALGLAVLKRAGLRSLEGSEISVPPKVLGRGTRYWAGGILFGLGWGLVGACPGRSRRSSGSGTRSFSCRSWLPSAEPGCTAGSGRHCRTKGKAFTCCSSPLG